MKTLLRWCARAGAGVLAIVLLFEEWGWEPLQRGLARLARLPLVGRLEQRIARLPPYAALALFGVPALALLPVKLLALAFVARGHAVIGIAVIVLAKVVGTAVVARLYLLTQPALMRLAWFARAHARWVPWKERLLARARASWPWRAGRLLKRRLRRWFTRTASSR